MRPPVSPHPIRPKISTMPRQKTEAAAYLELYKLVNEKKRLQQELEALEQRRDRIQSRLEVLNTQISHLEDDAHQLRDSTIPAAKPPRMQTNTRSSTFDTVYLEY